MFELLVYSFILQSLTQYVREQLPRIDGRYVMPVVFALALIVSALTPALTDAAAALLALPVHSPVAAVLWSAVLLTFGAKGFHSWQKRLGINYGFQAVVRDDAAVAITRAPTPDDPDA